MKISVENFKANWKGLNRQKQKMALKPEMTSDQSKVTSSIVITSNLGFIHVPKEETFPISLKYFDVTRTTQTNLDVM